MFFLHSPIDKLLISSIKISELIDLPLAIAAFTIIFFISLGILNRIWSSLCVAFARIAVPLSTHSGAIIDIYLHHDISIEYGEAIESTQFTTPL